MYFLRRRGRTSAGLAGGRGRWIRRPRVESLEARELLATVSVNAGQVIRTVDTQLLGVNVVNWDSNLNTGQTQQMVQAGRVDDVPVPRRVDLG